MISTITSETVSKFRDNYTRVLKQLVDGPVLLVQNSKTVAVLIGVDQWNAREQRLKELELVLEAQRVKAKNAPMVTLAEVKRRIAAKQQAHHVAN